MWFFLYSIPPANFIERTWRNRRRRRRCLPQHSMVNIMVFMPALLSRCAHYILLYNFFLCIYLLMVVLCNRARHYIFAFYISLFLFSSPNLSGRRLDVYHTLAHGVALVRI